MTTEVTERKKSGPKPGYSNQAIVNAFVAAIEGGNSVANACRMIGVSDSAFYNWMNWADEPDAAPALIEFKRKVEAAQTKIEQKMLAKITEAAFNGEWRAAQFWLERRRPDDWGARQSIAVEQGKPKPDAAMDARIAAASQAAKTQKEIVLMLNRQPDKSKWPPELFAAYQKMVNPKSIMIEGQ
ncbi:MAG: transposase [Acidiphilium sp.]